MPQLPLSLYKSVNPHSNATALLLNEYRITIRRSLSHSTAKVYTRSPLLSLLSSEHYKSVRKSTFECYRTAYSTSQTVMSRRLHRTVPLQRSHTDKHICFKHLCVIRSQPNTVKRQQRATEKVNSLALVCAQCGVRNTLPRIRVFRHHRLSYGQHY